MVFGSCKSKSYPGNTALLPLRTRTRGPAYTLPLLPPSTSAIDVDPDSESYDPLDEVLSLFRANTFFRNFEIKGPADRLLIYGILFVSECLGKIKATMGQRDAEKVRSLTVGGMVTALRDVKICFGKILTTVEIGSYECSVGSICYTGRCQFSIKSSIRSPEGQTRC